MGEWLRSLWQRKAWWMLPPAVAILAAVALLLIVIFGSAIEAAYPRF